MSNVQLVVVGSVGLDTIQTPAAQREEILGGSASYACGAASRFARAGMLAVAGDDFPRAALNRFNRLGIDLQGFSKVPGKTFRWSGVYEVDMNQRSTLRTELNVFADFMPVLPLEYRAAPFLFLANIAPSLQLHVLDQSESARWIAADTMDLWIRTARKDLLNVIKRVQILFLNDSEIRMLTGKSSPVKAARQILKWGPQFVVVKRGEFGSLLVTRDGVRLLPAYPVERVTDPTGAGDAFAGGLLGSLAGVRQITTRTVFQAMLMGTVTASFAVESFGLDRLAALNNREIEKRKRDFLAMLKLG